MKDETFATPARGPMPAQRRAQRRRRRAPRARHEAVVAARRDLRAHPTAAGRRGAACLLAEARRGAARAPRRRPGRPRRLGPGRGNRLPGRCRRGRPKPRAPQPLARPRAAEQRDAGNARRQPPGLRPAACGARCPQAARSRRSLAGAGAEPIHETSSPRTLTQVGDAFVDTRRAAVIASRPRNYLKLWGERP